MDKSDEVVGLVSAYAEADQQLSTNLELARENVAKLVSAVEKHSAAMAQLRQDHADGKLDTATLERQLDEQSKLIERLNWSRIMFELRVANLEARLGDGA